MQEFFLDSLKVKHFSDVKVVKKEKGKSYEALLLNLKVVLYYESNDFDFNDDNEKEIDFYYLVQKVDNEIQDKSLSVDHMNETWIELNNEFNEELISLLKSEVKRVFDDYLEKRQVS